MRVFSFRWSENVLSVFSFHLLYDLIKPINYGHPKSIFQISIIILYLSGSFYFLLQVTLTKAFTKEYRTEENQQQHLTTVAGFSRPVLNNNGAVARGNEPIHRGNAAGLDAYILIRDT